jgi:hypothetical protein
MYMFFGSSRHLIFHVGHKYWNYVYNIYFFTSVEVLYCVLLDIFIIGCCLVLKFLSVVLFLLSH